MEISDFFKTHSEFYIKQSKEWLEIFTGWEAKNKYRVCDKVGVQIGWVLETGTGFLYQIKKFFLRSHRPLNVNFLDMDGKRFLHFHREFFWIWSDLYVEDNHGKKLGSVHRRFAFFHKKYDLCNAAGRTLGMIESPFWSIWTFKVTDERDFEIGSINKKWGGFLKEMFSDADSFQVKVNPNDSEIMNSLIMSAAISIDIDYFDNNTGKSGLIDLIDT